MCIYLQSCEKLSTPLMEVLAVGWSVTQCHNLPNKFPPRSDCAMLKNAAKTQGDPSQTL